MKLAVIGHPVAHSRSPAMQNAALAALGLAGEWSYEAIDVAPGGFAALVEGLPARGFAGVNVTVPHKLAALAVAERASDAARAIGAANTLSFNAGRIEAENTDAGGLIAALPAPPDGAQALVLGAGGSARAVVWALRQAGAEVLIWNRTPERAERLAAELDARAIAGDARAASIEADLLVNCTTIGMDKPDRGRYGGQTPLARGIEDLKALPIAVDALRADQVVVDLTYRSHQTPLIAAARSRGATPIDGLEVLVMQGAESLRIWTGAEPPLDVMRAAARGESRGEPA